MKHIVGQCWLIGPYKDAKCNNHQFSPYNKAKKQEKHIQINKALVWEFSFKKGEGGEKAIHNLYKEWALLPNRNIRETNNRPKCDKRLVFFLTVPNIKRVANNVSINHMFMGISLNLL